MLVLSRKVGEQVVINNNITVKILEIRGGVIRIGIEAPRDVPVHRTELLERAGTGPTAGPGARARRVPP
jgi:carbon storage regulator